MASELTIPLTAGQVVDGLELGLTPYTNLGLGVGVRWPFTIEIGRSGKGGQAAEGGALFIVVDASFISPKRPDSADRLTGSTGRLPRTWSRWARRGMARIGIIVEHQVWIVMLFLSFGAALMAAEVPVDRRLAW